MKVTELWKSKSDPTLSFELFPARGEKAAKRLDKAIDKLAALNPDFVSVTFGAGGSTREGSYQLLEKLSKDKGLKVIAYFACFGLGPDDIVAVLDSYKDLGIQTILAVRGDPPHDNPDFVAHSESLAYASDLVKFINEKYDFCLGGAGYPEGHIDAESFEKDFGFAKLKVDNGAEFLVTNYTYNNQKYFDYVSKIREAGIDVPILPGVMPIYNVKMMNNLAKLCGAEITNEINEGISKLPEGDKEALHEFGVDFAYKQCKEMIEKGVTGLHFYTMDRAKSVVAIVSKLREQGLLK